MIDSIALPHWPPTNASPTPYSRSSPICRMSRASPAAPHSAAPRRAMLSRSPVRSERWRRLPPPSLPAPRLTPIAPSCPASHRYSHRSPRISRAPSSLTPPLICARAACLVTATTSNSTKRGCYSAIQAFGSRTTRPSSSLRAASDRSKSASTRCSATTSNSPPSTPPRRHQASLASRRCAMPSATSRPSSSSSRKKFCAPRPMASPAKKNFGRRCWHKWPRTSTRSLPSVNAPPNSMRCRAWRRSRGVNDGSVRKSCRKQAFPSKADATPCSIERWRRTSFPTTPTSPPPPIPPRLRSSPARTWPARAPTSARSRSSRYSRMSAHSCPPPARASASSTRSSPASAAPTRSTPANQPSWSR